MKKKACLTLGISLALTAIFALVLFVMFFLSGSILPSGGEADAGETLGLSIGYVLIGIVFTLVPSVLIVVAFVILDICLAAVKNKKPTLIACMVIVSIFLPLFAMSTVPYFMIVNYAKWIYAILIPAYIAYLSTIVTCAIALSAENKAGKRYLCTEQDAFDASGNSVKNDDTP